jgi:hypothetical protein
LPDDAGWHHHTRVAGRSRVSRVANEVNLRATSQKGREEVWSGPKASCSQLAADGTTHVGTGRHPAPQGDTIEADPCVARATLGSGARKGVGVRVPPLAPRRPWATTKPRTGPSCVSRRYRVRRRRRASPFALRADLGDAAIRSQVADRDVGRRSSLDGVVAAVTLQDVVASVARKWSPPSSPYSWSSPAPPTSVSAAGSEPPPVSSSSPPSRTEGRCPPCPRSGRCRPDRR